MPSHALLDFGAHRSANDRLDLTAAAPYARPIDLVHLSRQSLGDGALEIELLTLFERQAEQIADRLAAPTSNSERRWRHDLAHTLKGSALAVGAMTVAAAAQTYEEALFDGTEASAGTACDALRAAVAQARSAVRELLGEG